MARPEYARNDAQSALGLANQQLVLRIHMLQVIVDACSLATVVCAVHSVFVAGCSLHNMLDDGTTASVCNHIRHVYVQNKLLIW